MFVKNSRSTFGSKTGSKESLWRYYSYVNHTNPTKNYERVGDPREWLTLSRSGRVFYWILCSNMFVPIPFIFSSVPRSSFGEIWDFSPPILLFFCQNSGFKGTRSLFDFYNTRFPIANEIAGLIVVIPYYPTIRIDILWYKLAELSSFFFCIFSPQVK